MENQSQPHKPTSALYVDPCEWCGSDLKLSHSDPYPDGTMFCPACERREDENGALDL